MASERGVVAPAGTPPAILARLREATEDIAQDPEFVKQLEARFTEPAYEPGEAWFTRLRAAGGRLPRRCGSARPGARDSGGRGNPGPSERCRAGTPRCIVQGRDNRKLISYRSNATILT